MWKMTFTHHSKGDSAGRQKLPLRCFQQLGEHKLPRLKKWTPGQSTDPSATATATISMTRFWHSPPSNAPHKAGSGGLLSCLTFNWSDKPMRPRYLRDGTVLLAAPGRWVGKARVRAHHHAPMHLQPHCSRTGLCLGRHCQSPRTVPNVGLCDVGRCLQGPERGQADTYCDLSLKERREQAHAWVTMQASLWSNLSPSPTSIDAGNNKKRQVYSVDWARRNGSLLCFRDLCEQSMSLC